MSTRRRRVLSRIRWIGPLKPLVLSVGLALAGAASSAHAFPLASIGSRAMDKLLADSAALDQLKVGKVKVKAQNVSGSDYKRALAIGIIDAAPEKVWAVIEDCGNYAGRLPRMLVSRVRKQSGAMRECEVTIDFPNPFADAVVVTKAVDSIQPGTRWHRTWTLVEGEFNKNSGSWTLVPYQGRTLAVYEVHVEPKRAIPPVLQKAVQAKAIPKLFAKLGELAR